ncbi:MAG: fused MFS/spermidine synthase [Halobacteria archaeon]
MPTNRATRLQLHKVLPPPLSPPDDVEKVLFIGGGFTGPKAFLEYHDVNVDVMEIDPEVVDVANDYFNVSQYNMTVIQGDSRRYLRETNRTYNVIVLDAYKKTRTDPTDYAAVRELDVQQDGR